MLNIYYVIFYIWKKRIEQEKKVQYLIFFIAGGQDRHLIISLSWPFIVSSCIKIINKYIDNHQISVQTIYEAYFTQIYVVEINYS